MAKVFKIMVPDYSLISRTLYNESLSTELYVIDRLDKKFITDHAEDLSKPALYILANRDEKKLYIGKTGDSLTRLHNHQSKEFWTEAIVYHSTHGTDTLSTTEVEWLEAKTYEIVKELGYYDLSENTQKPKYPTLKRDQEINCPEYFETAKNYICAAGFDIFLKKKTDAEELSKPQALVKTKSDLQHNIWLICYDKKYFDVEGCFKKYGQIYWTHKAGVLNVQKGDIVYLYAARPESAIRFKVEVVASQLPYSPEMDVEDEFAASGNSNSDGSNKTYFLVRPIAETHSSALKHEAMMSRGLMGKRPSTTLLSKDKFKPLQKYIEDHFNDMAKEEQKPTSKPKTNKKGVATKPNQRKKPAPPFLFSMIGLKPGDKVIFDALNIEVTVASDNTIRYNGREYRLTTFCKEFLPEEKRIKSNAYQGPDYFSYQGKSLKKVRKERENQKG